MDDSNSESVTTTTTVVKLNLQLDEQENEKCLNNNIDGEEPEAVKVVNLLKHSQSVKKGWRQYIGMLSAFGSSICLTFALGLVKILPNYHPLGLAFYRHWGNIIPIIPVIIYYSCWKKQAIFVGVWPFEKNWKNVAGLVARGIFGATAVVLRFLSLEYLTLADSTVVTYSGPILTIILAHYFLGEELSCVSITTGIFMLFGVAIISRPSFLTNSEFDINILIGICIIVGVVICQSTVFILVRGIRTLHFSVMQLAFGTVGVTECFIVAIATGTLTIPHGFRDISLIILLAILSFFGQFLTIIALKFDGAGNVGLVRIVDVIFSFIWTAIFLDEPPDLFSLIGGLIVAFGIAVIGLRKYLTTLSQDNKFKQRLWFLLK